MRLDSIHANIRKLREDLGLSQEAMAHEIKVSRSAYFNFETGVTPLYCRSLVRMSRYTGAPEEIILHGGLTPESLLNDNLEQKEVFRAMSESYEILLAEKDAECRALEARLREYEALYGPLPKKA